MLVALALMVAAGDAPPPDLRPKEPAPVPAERLEAAIRKGVAHLLATQNKDGSWGSPALLGGVAITAGIGSHHTFGVAVTGMGVVALHEAGGDSPEVRAAVDKADAYLARELPKVKRDNPMLIYNCWAHAYGLQALVRLHRRAAGDAAKREQLAGLMRGQFEKLQKYESAEGGWGYYDFNAGTQRPASSSTSFVNAAVLVALREAKDAGVEPPAKLVERAVKMTQKQRQSDGSFQYGTYLWDRPTMSINQPGGSLGRSQACHLALRLWGDPAASDSVMKAWLDRLITRNGWLSMGRKKPVPHESFFLVAGYFYYFGHYYAGEAIRQLPPVERPFYQDHLAAIILELQEADGSWWDYPFYGYHKPYGTSFALMTLAACRKEGAAR